LTTAFIEGEIVVQPLAEVVTGYNFTDLDPQLWEAMIERVGDGDMVCAPVTAQGTAFGALGFVTRSTRTWTNADIAYLDGLSSILGIWATHHLSGVRTPEVWRPVTQDTLTLSPRQLDILRLVELGKSNAAIAFALGYSASTVKAELQRVLRVLKVGDRQAAVATARELGLLSDPEEVTAG
jgi:DNA-binding NarL/FixJ family response regulator